MATPVLKAALFKYTFITSFWEQWCMFYKSNLIIIVEEVHFKWGAFKKYTNV